MMKKKLKFIYILKKYSFCEGEWETIKYFPPCKPTETKHNCLGGKWKIKYKRKIICKSHL